MKVVKKVFSLVLSCLIISATSTPAFAQSNQSVQNALKPINIVQDTTIKSPVLKYYPCPGNGSKHHMVGRGRGKAYKGAYPSTNLQINGYCTQCRDCHLFIISEYEPLWAGTTCLGKYTVGNADEDLSNICTFYYTNDFWYNSSLANDSFFRSFSWYPHG